MKISEQEPPYGVMQKCQQKFDLSGVKPVFTFGDTIYNPYEMPVGEALVSHEMVHMVQQGEKPHEWWDAYLSDKDFRFKQELEAYRVQYRVAKSILKDRNMVARLLFAISGDLSGEMYGKMCTRTQAFKLIKDGI